MDPNAKDALQKHLASHGVSTNPYQQPFAPRPALPVANTPYQEPGRPALQSASSAYQGHHGPTPPSLSTAYQEPGRYVLPSASIPTQGPPRPPLTSANTTHQAPRRSIPPSANNPAAPSTTTTSLEHFVSMESRMEKMAMKMNKRKEFFQSLQKRRDEANLKFSECTADYRQWYAQSLVWQQWFSPAPFPGQKCLPYHRNFSNAEKREAIAAVNRASPARDLSGLGRSRSSSYSSSAAAPAVIPTHHGASGSLSRPSSSHSGHGRREKEEVDLKTLKARFEESQQRGAELERRLSELEHCAKAKRAKGVHQLGDQDTGRTRHSDTYSPSYSPSRPEVNHTRIDHYEPSTTHSAQKGDYYRPEDKDKVSASRSKSRTLSSTTEPRSSLSSESIKTNKASKSSYPYGRSYYKDKDEPPMNVEYGKLSYSDGVSPAKTSKTSQTNNTISSQGRAYGRLSPIDPKEFEDITKNNSTNAKPQPKPEQNPTSPQVAVEGWSVYTRNETQMKTLFQKFKDEYELPAVKDALQCTLFWQKLGNGDLRFGAIPYLVDDLATTENAERFLDGWILAAEKGCTMVQYINNQKVSDRPSSFEDDLAGLIAEESANAKKRKYEEGECEGEPEHTEKKSRAD